MRSRGWRWMTRGMCIMQAVALAAVSCTSRNDVPATSPLSTLRDASAPDVHTAAPRGVRLKSGAIVAGELFARYDHALWWWDTSPAVTYGIIDPQSFDGWYERDHSIRFLDGELLAETPSQVAVPSAMRSFMRDENIVIHGSPLSGVAKVLNGNEDYHLKEGGFGDFAWDFVKVGADGRTFRTDGLSASDYYVFGEPVTLPTGGVIIDLFDAQPDNVPGAIPPGPMDAIPNNMIGVALGGSYYLYVLHFKQGSIPTEANGNCAPAVPGVKCLRKGMYVGAGTYLGLAGNSGVTYEPHVHVTMYYYDASLPTPRSFSVPSEFADIYLAEANAPAARASFAIPRTGQKVSNTPF